MDGRKAVTSAQMKEIEKRAAEGGLSYYQMMENAGEAAVLFMIDQETVAGKNILIFCGKGNNGGDGFVAARKLQERKACVTLILVEGEPKTEDAIKNKRLCEAAGIKILDAKDQAVESLAKDANLILDAIYGTGFHGELREAARKTAQMVNRARAKVYALDIPSGMNSDDGTADRDTICADVTIAFHRFKPAHLMKQSEEYCGQLICADIGIREMESWEALES